MCATTYSFPGTDRCMIRNNHTYTLQSTKFTIEMITANDSSSCLCYPPVALCNKHSFWIVCHISRKYYIPQRKTKGISNSEVPGVAVTTIPKISAFDSPDQWPVQRQAANTNSLGASVYSASECLTVKDPPGCVCVCWTFNKPCLEEGSFQGKSESAE